MTQDDGVEMQNRLAAIPADRQHYVEIKMSGGALFKEGEPLIAMEVILHDLMDEQGNLAEPEPNAPKSVLVFGLADMKVLKRTIERLEAALAEMN